METQNTNDPSPKKNTGGPRRDCALIPAADHRHRNAARRSLNRSRIGRFSHISEGTCSRFSPNGGRSHWYAFCFIDVTWKVSPCDFFAVGDFQAVGQVLAEIESRRALGAAHPITSNASKPGNQQEVVIRAAVLVSLSGRSFLRCVRDPSRKHCF